MTINEKLCAIQVRLKAPKSQKCKFANFSYRSAEDIFEAAKSLLAEYAVSLVVSDEIVEMGDRFYVKSTATLTGSDGSVSATGFAREEAEKKGMDPSQITGSASSYARKYALSGLFAIDDTKDADALPQGSNQVSKAEEKAPVTVLKVAAEVPEDIVLRLPSRSGGQRDLSLGEMSEEQLRYLLEKRREDLGEDLASAVRCVLEKKRRAAQGRKAG